MGHGIGGCFYKFVTVSYTAFVQNYCQRSKVKKMRKRYACYCLKCKLCYLICLKCLPPAGNRELISDQNFMRELFGTRAHVDSLMSVLGWSRHNSSGSDTEPNNELFLWAVLMGRTELAMLFWRRLTNSRRVNCISHALFASAVASRLAAVVDGNARRLLVGDCDNEDSAKSQQSQPIAVHFEDLAKQLMKECFDTDHQTTADVIQLKWTDNCWQDSRGPSPEYMSSLRLARLAHAESFVDDPAFQSCVDSIWFGRIALYESIKASGERLGDVYLLIPFAGGSLLQHVFLFIAAGGLCIPVFVFSIFNIDEFEICAFAFLGSYIAPLLCILYLGFFNANHTLNKPKVNDIQPGHGLYVKLHTLWRMPRTLSSLLWRISLIFYSAPVVRFLGRNIHFALFVLLYTYVGITLQPDRYLWEEGVMHFWVISLFIMEMRQLSENGWSRWTESFWNCLDALSLCSYGVALVFRIIEYENVIIKDRGYIFDFRNLGGYQQGKDSLGRLDHQVSAAYQFEFQDLMQARGLHGLVGILFWVRLFEALKVSSSLGPLVLTMGEIFRRDVGRFLLVLVVLMLGFGSAFVCAARPYPDRVWRCNGGSNLGETYWEMQFCLGNCTGQCEKQLWRYISNSVSYSYFSIFGEHYLDSQHYFASNVLSDNLDGAPDNNRFLGPSLQAVYLLVAALILTNLLIAMMNTTYSNIQEKNQQKFRYQRMELALDVLSEPLLPPPLGYVIDMQYFFTHFALAFLIVTMLCFIQSYLFKVWRQLMYFFTFRFSLAGNFSDNKQRVSVMK